VIPFVTDAPEDLDLLVARARDAGCAHVVASVLDIPFGIREHVFRRLETLGRDVIGRIRGLYSEWIDGWMHAAIDYRRQVFDLLRSSCDRRGLTFALCMEYELVEGEPLGLNRTYMSSRNCEGIDIPLYVRRGKAFEPLTDCPGNCLSCAEPRCGIGDLALAAPGVRKRSFRLSDYRRWSRELVWERLGMDES
jgi:hypothetical protein